MQTRGATDAACGGSFGKKTPTEAFDIIAEMAQNNAQWSANERQSGKKNQQADIYKVETNTALEAKLEAMTKKLEALMATKGQSSSKNDWSCMSIEDQMEEVNAISQKDFDPKSGMQEAMLKFMQRHGHLCMGVLAGFMEKTEERLKAIENKSVKASCNFCGVTTHDS